MSVKVFLSSWIAYDISGTPVKGFYREDIIDQMIYCYAYFSETNSRWTYKVFTREFAGDIFSPPTCGYATVQEAKDAADKLVLRDGCVLNQDRLKVLK
jgi:hypothetical protein